jgi:hypothetical protein
MYWCDGCGRFRGHMSFQHMHHGERCTGTEHEVTYVKREENAE